VNFPSPDLPRKGEHPIEPLGRTPKFRWFFPASWSNFVFLLFYHPN
jgi:hypothetical protein